MGKARKRSRRKPGARRYADYSVEMLELAVGLVRDKVLTSYEAEKQFDIPRRTIVNKSKDLHKQPYGRPTELSTEEEAHIADVVNVAAEFGCPLTLLDLRIVVHNYVMKSGKNIFNGKMPGERWVRCFLERHNFSQRVTQNIKKSRASKTVEEMNEFYENLQNSLKDVPPANILNFDETNLSDDPGSKKCVFKRGTKHPERVINASKSAVSIMFSGTADGICLPPYVVYKADHLWSKWCENGPKNARYNRTKSGWFDMMCFDDWFKTIVLPWANSQDGIKLVIGDNLASHLSLETIQLCRSHNIRFVFLPKSATHLTQPLDVSFFGPMKRRWREILTNYKATYSNASTINKCHFPQLLQELMSKIEMTKENNLRKGFEGSGIYPFNPSKVIEKIPTVQEENTHKFDISLLEFLQRNRQTQPMKTGKNSKLTVVPGKSVSTEEAEEQAKAKKIKNGTKKTKLKEKNKSNLPGPSKTTSKKLKHTEVKSSNLEEEMSSSVDPDEPNKDTTLETNLTESHTSSLMHKYPDSLSSLCISAINIYLSTSKMDSNSNEFVDSNEFVHLLKNVSKNSDMNTAFYKDVPQSLQMKTVDIPKNGSKAAAKLTNKKKIIITSNILIKAASPEKSTVLQNIDTQMNKRKRKQTTTVQKQRSKTKRQKKAVYKSDSSSSSEISYHVVDTDDDGDKDLESYIAECLQHEDYGQENVPPFGLSDIDFYMTDSLKFQEDNWILAKFASKKSVKYFIGQVLSINNRLPTVKFVRKVKNSKCDKGIVFTYPNIEDVCVVHDLNDVIAVLPDPQISRRGQFIFNIDLDKYNVQ